jgi:hypothetical protein
MIAVRLRALTLLSSLAAGIGTLEDFECSCYAVSYVFITCGVHGMVGRRTLHNVQAGLLLALGVFVDTHTSIAFDVD